jgi:hypothetical protein
MNDPDFPRRIAYMVIGGLSIYFGFQYAGLCFIAVGKLVHVF